MNIELFTVFHRRPAYRLSMINDIRGGENDLIIYYLNSSAARVLFSFHYH
jgi:hypothetical protein